MEQNKKDTAISGQVIEALPNAFFKIKRDDNGEETMGYLAGKMRLNRIRVLIGDRVMIELDPYGGKGRIIKRL